jgi:hypothetical protein
VEQRNDDRRHESRLSKNVGTSIGTTRTKFTVGTGAETASPEFRKKIKDKYVQPSKCVSVPVSTCDGPGTYPPSD